MSRYLTFYNVYAKVSRSHRSNAVIVPVHTCGQQPEIGKPVLRNLRHKKLIVLLTAILTTFGIFTALNANAGGTGGDYPGEPPYCATGTPSGVSQLSYSEYAGEVQSFVYTANESNCSTTVNVTDLTKSVKNGVIYYKAAPGVTFSYASVSVIDQYDVNQYAQYSIPLKAGTTAFSINTADLPYFVHHTTVKGKKKNVLVHRIGGIFISGTDSHYPAPPTSNGCDPNGCG